MILRAAFDAAIAFRHLHISPAPLRRQAGHCAAIIEFPLSAVFATMPFRQMLDAIGCRLRQLLYFVS